MNTFQILLHVSVVIAKLNNLSSRPIPDLAIVLLLDYYSVWPRKHILLTSRYVLVINLVSMCVAVCHLHECIKPDI